MMISPVKTKKSAEEHDSGFTLIELSIVLVIIGLIVGGILTGQDLIKAAEQRATIAQIEKYNTAVNTFRNKYGYIPGDMPIASVSSFGLEPTAGVLTVGGDGNGLIEDGQVSGTTDINGNTPFGEILLFWNQLSSANLIDGNYDASITTGAVGSGTTSNDFPLSKLARGNYITVGSDLTNGFNAFGLAGLAASYTATSGSAKYGAGTDNLTPLESYNMDKKVDDGVPNTGSVQARTDTALATRTNPASVQGPLSTTNASIGGASAASGQCQYGSATTTLTSNTYNVGGNFGTTPSCSMRFRFN